MNLMNKGLINVTAYSLWVDDHDALTGTILFGGIDKSKFEGELVNIDIVPIVRHIRSMYYIDIATIAVHVDGKRSEVLSRNPIFRFRAVLDPTTSWSFLPIALGSRLARKIGGTVYKKALGMFIIDCERGQSHDFVEFEFAGVKIPVLLKQLVSKVGESEDGKPVCALAFTAMQPRPGEQVIHSFEYSIGDSVLRSAYVVYDMQNKVVSIAKRASNGKVARIYALNSSGVPAGLIGQPETPLPTIHNMSTPNYGSTTLAVYRRAVVIVVVLILGFYLWSIYNRRRRRAKSTLTTDRQASFPKSH
ncbi:aspartic peptidase domain-containing protein [Lipomyces orientalis]|uniref:Aspartic peptidase domain-containing protein n=1 Tax=Lipomyces orientalis TaxID=1233043 RepID=A0ACC3TJE0_9ASCO